MRIRTLLIPGVLGIASVSLGWGPGGHRQIADIAWSQLNRKAKTEIAKILFAGDTVTYRGKDEPFSLSEQPITDAFLEESVRPAFDDASNWCDAIKGGKSGKFEDRIRRDNDASPGVDPSKKGEDIRCKSWHYYDKPIAVDPNSHPPRESNGLRALPMEEKLLEEEQRKASPDRAAEAYSLYWVEHLFGDLHQPLHCVSNFMIDSLGDAGGNGFKLGIPSGYRAGEMTNLHAFWDSGIDHAVAADPKLGGDVSTEKVTSTWLNEKRFQPTKAEIENLDVRSWINQGWLYAQNVVYNGIAPGGTPSQEYKDKQDQLCERLALLAGFRLANYLNRTLGK